MNHIISKIENKITIDGKIKKVENVKEIVKREVEEFRNNPEKYPYNSGWGDKILEVEIIGEDMLIMVRAKLKGGFGLSSVSTNKLEYLESESSKLDEVLKEVEEELK